MGDGLRRVPVVQIIFPLVPLTIEVLDLGHDSTVGVIGVKNIKIRSDMSPGLSPALFQLLLALLLLGLQVADLLLLLRIRACTDTSSYTFRYCSGISKCFL